MAIVNPTTGSAPSAAAGQSSVLAQQNAEIQDRFLTMLVTQLQNQDPLNPMDNAEVTSQMAQLSMVSGVQQLNDTLLALSGQMDLSQSLQAANFIGKDIFVPGDKIRLGNSVATPFGYEVYSAASNVNVTILNGSGLAVRSMDLGPAQQGIQTLTWDGMNDQGQPVVDGAYTVQVSATDADGKAVAADALISGKVGGVAYSSAGLRLDLGLVGSYSLFDVRKVL
jgi:flagellar basal-body rod modification protein FlgD